MRVTLAVALLIATSMGVHLDNSVLLQTDEEIMGVAVGKYTMTLKKCDGLKDAAKATCTDENLIIEKSNAAIKHCVHSSHHDKTETLKCIHNAVDARNADMKDKEEGHAAGKSTDKSGAGDAKTAAKEKKD